MKIKYENYSKTFRLVPKNYWLASVKNNKLFFDSWDGQAKKLFKQKILLKFRIVLFYIKLRIIKKL